MDRRTQKTKTAIQNAYFSLLMENEKEGHITIADIARKADIDRKTFYLHYSSIEDILREFSHDTANKLLTLLKKDGFFERPFDVHMLFRDLNDLVLRDIEFYKHLIHTSAVNFIWTEIQNLVVGTVKKVYSGIVTITQEELDIYARFYAAGVTAIYAAWLRRDTSLNIDKLGEVAADVTYYGVEKIIASGNELKEE